MKTIRVGLAAALLAAVLGGCGGDPRAEIEQVYRDQHAALLARDFARACSYNGPDATEMLLISVRTQGVAVNTCEEAFAAIYEQPAAADTADGVSRSFRVDSVEVDGDQAVVSWTASLDGTDRPAVTTVRRIDGDWKLSTPRA